MGLVAKNGLYLCGIFWGYYHALDMSAQAGNCECGSALHRA
jgi:hypothetical protein